MDKNNLSTKKDDEEKVYFQKFNIKTTFNNDHNDLNNSIEGDYKIYYNELGIAIYTKLKIKKATLNINGKTRFERDFRDLFVNGEKRKNGESILGEKAYNAFKNKKTVELTDDQLKRLNKLLNELDKKDDEVINNILFGNKNNLGVKLTSDEEKKKKLLLDSRAKVLLEKTNTFKTYIKEKKEEGNLYEKTDINHWLNKILDTYEKINISTNIETIRKNLETEGINDKTFKRIKKFLTNNTKKLTNLLFICESQTRNYRVGFFKEFLSSITQKLYT